MNETNKRNIGIGLALAGLAGGAIVFLLVNLPENAGEIAAESPSPPEISKPTGRPDSAKAPELRKKPPAPGAPDRKTVVIHDIARTSLQLHQSDADPEEDLMIILNLVDFYRRVCGANPEGGLNFEIVEKLTGTNERNLAMLTPDHPSLNAEGELLDRWGTPYWFHPVSRELMEIVSAGPDKQLWTEDDVRID